jgi:hypothetical protein
MTAVTLTESRQYVLWLSLKVISALLVGFLFLVAGALIVGGYFVGNDMTWYVLAIGLLFILSGLLTLYTTLLGIFYKLIADGVEAGIASAHGLEYESSPSVSLDSLLDRFR